MKQASCITIHTITLTLTLTLTGTHGRRTVLLAPVGLLHGVRACTLSSMVPLGHHKAMGATMRASERLTLTHSTYLRQHGVLLTLACLIRSPSCCVQPPMAV